MHAFTKRLQGYGRFGDKLLAHLSPKEARILKKAGGSGTVNPFTGALEYYKGTLGGRGVNPFADDTTPVNQPSTMSTDKPQAKDAFLNLAETWQNNQPQQQDKGIDPRMMNFARIMQNTYDRADPGTDGETRAEYSEGSKSIENMLKYTMGINSNLHDRLIDRGVDDQWNEDKAPGRVDEVISFMFTPNSQGNTGFEMFGGQEALLKAYQELGVTGEGTSYADRQVNDFLKDAKDFAREYNHGQTSMTMGEEKGPEFAGEFTGSWSDAFDQITREGVKVIGMLTPSGSVANHARAMERAFRYKIPFTTAMMETLGFSPTFNEDFTPDPEDGEW